MNDTLTRMLDALRAHGHEPKQSGGAWTCRCPAHEDQNPSLSIREGDDGRVLLHCHAGCQTEKVVAAVGLKMSDLFEAKGFTTSRPPGKTTNAPPANYERPPTLPRERGIPWAGRALDAARALKARGFAVVPVPFKKKRPTAEGWPEMRIAEEDLPQHFGSKGNVGILPGEPSGRRIDIDIDDPLAVMLAPEYLPKTGAVFGRESKPRSHHIYVVKDPIETAKFQRPPTPTEVKERIELGASKKKANAPVMVVEVRADRCQTIGPGSVHPSGQPVEWYADGEPAEVGAQELLEAVTKLQARVRMEYGFAAEDAADDDSEGDGEGERKGKTNQRDIIVRLARELYRFGRTMDDEPFAVLNEGPNIARMLRGGKNSLRAELARSYSIECGSSPSSGALIDAMLVLEGDTLLAAPEPVYLRLARVNETVILDLGDHEGRAVVIDSTGWKVVGRSPVVFRRTALIGPLPVPAAGGSLEIIKQKLNISSEQWPLVVGWLVAALIPDIEHAIVLLGGQQDAGKSTTARSLAGLVDPSPAPLRAPPRDLEQWAVAAVGSWVVVLDNISGVAEWLSDAMCRAVTGEGLVRRALFTDDLVSVLVFQRCLMLTSIDAGALKGDLGRRLIQLDLEPVNPTKKRPPRVLRMEYERDRPAMLGALLDVLVKVLEVLPTIQLDQFFGLADFEQVLAAVDKVQGTNALAQYRGQWERIAADVVESDLVAAAVRTLAEKGGLEFCWEGTAGELLKKLTPEHPPKKWPDNPTKFAGDLRRAIPALRAVGVEVIPPTQKNKRREYRVQLTARTARPPKEAAGGGKNADSEQGGCSGGSDNRPANRPPPEPNREGQNADSGRSGGQGGLPPGFSALRDADFDHDEADDPPDLDIPV